MRVLLLYPEFPQSIWSFDAVMKLRGKKSVMPSLGLLTVAAIMPQEWEYRYVDTNCQPVTDEDWQWAELVMLTGMIVQREHMFELIRQAKAYGLSVIVGGPYATSEPDRVKNAGADFLVLDEAEVSAKPFLEALSKGEVSGTFTANGERPDITASPTPRFDLINFDDYEDMSLQYSRGCPFLCEFCDIIELYGRNPRTKSSSQILAELKLLYDLGWRNSVFIVDDNFIGNKKNVKNLLAEIVPWQKKFDYPFSFFTEASVNLADDDALLSQMNAANFQFVFLGIETPDVESLKLTHKAQNTRRPLVDSIHKIQKAGMKIMGGFIIGFDNEKPGADVRIQEFGSDAAIPHMMVSMLQALPMTQLKRRLIKEGRFIGGSGEVGVNQTNMMNFIPTRPIREIAEEYMNCFWGLYDPKNYLDRVYQQCLNVQRGPSLKKGKSKTTIDDLKLLVKMCLRLTFVHKMGFRFWRRLYSVWRLNPRELMSFINFTCHYEHFTEFRHLVHSSVRQQLIEIDKETAEKSYQGIAGS